MRRGIALALLGTAALAGGCAGQARFVQKNVDGTGTVAVSDNSNMWPTYNRREALAKIQEHVGPNFEIVSEGEVGVGQSTTSDAQVNSLPVGGKKNRGPDLELQTVRGTTTSRDITEYHIMYRRIAAPAAGGAPNGIAPAGGVQPAAGVAPGESGIQPAGASGMPPIRPVMRTSFPSGSCAP